MTNMAQSSFFDPSRLSAQTQARADEAVAALEAMADPERATGMASYMRDKFEFFGIASQPRKDAVKHILSGRSMDWDFVAALWLHPQRECQYVAVDHVRRHKLNIADLENLKAVVEAKPWWDTVDHLAKCAGTALVAGARGRGKEPNSLADAQATRALMLEWAVDDNLWTRRIAILCQLSFGEKTDKELLREVIESNLGADAAFAGEFFINKAIGWALRDYARKNPQWVRDFVDEHGEGTQLPLAKLSVREALKHL